MSQVTGGGAPPQLSPDGRWWWDGERWVPAAQAEQPSAPIAAQPGACIVCARTPAEPVYFRQHIGLVVVWSNRREGGVLCRDCAIAVFRRQMNRTLLTGWWGLLSFFLLNPFTIVYNLVRRWKAGRMPEPLPGVGPRAPLDKGRPVFLRPGLPLAVAGAAAVLVFASLQPKPPPTQFVSSSVPSPQPSAQLSHRLKWDFTPADTAAGDVGVAGTVTNTSGDTLQGVSITCVTKDTDGKQHEAAVQLTGDMNPGDAYPWSLTIPMSGAKPDDVAPVDCNANYRVVG